MGFIIDQLISFYDNAPDVWDLREQIAEKWKIRNGYF